MIARASPGSLNGIVFNVQRFSVHDGPGIRTTLFLKGCPLCCRWCDNPESQESRPQIVFWRERCIQCNACIAACTRSAIEMDESGVKRVRSETCDLCGDCLKECYAGALEQIGERMSVERAVALLEEDRAFYEQSGGGVTLSGGEPTNQGEFARGVLAGCQERGIATAIETCGHTTWSVWEILLPHLDLILFDLKHVDPVRHREYTAVSNELILDNLRRLAKAGKRVILRRPVIPGFNDDRASIEALGRLVAELGTVREVHLLPYHRFGKSKYERLGRAYPMGDVPSMNEKAAGELKEILLHYGPAVRIGG